MIRVLIADEMHPSIIPMLEKIGLEPDYKPSIKREEIIASIKDYEGLLIRSKTKIDKEVLDNAEKLQFIGRAGAGVDMIDSEIVNEKNIYLFAANEGNRVAVAEHVIGMLLCLTNNILIADKQVRNKVWLREENRGYEIMGRTVGLIGYGNNGSETAKRLKAFGCKVLAYDKYKTDFSDEYVSETSMEVIFEEAEIFSLHIPLTDESYQIVNEEFFNKFNHPIYFINASRGEIVNLKSLIKAINQGKVLGACLDVLENEKLKKLTLEQTEVFDELTSNDKIIFSPHIAGWTHESFVKINEVLVDKIDAFYNKN